MKFLLQNSAYYQYSLHFENITSHIIYFQYYPGSKRPVWFVFSGVGSQWPGMGKSLLQFPVFASAIEKCQEALKPHGVDVINVITSDDPRIFNNIVNCFVGIAACQVCILKQFINLTYHFSKILKQKF
jgi:acyl transferase domain-containing protein